MKKRLLSFALALGMCLTMLPMSPSARAAEEAVPEPEAVSTVPEVRETEASPVPREAPAPEANLPEAEASARLLAAGEVAIDQTNFPDDNFRAYVKTLSGAGDGVFTQEELSAITEINCSGYEKPDSEKIRTLTGIEHFMALTTLKCERNWLTELDMDQNLQLTDLNCSGNRLTELDVRQNAQLKDLDCSGNQLTKLDVRQNAQLKTLNCYFNDKLSALDVSRNTQLNYLSCRGNQMTALDVQQNTLLTELYCRDNQLTALDVGQNLQLTDLNCSGNQLTELDVSQNTKLTSLYCGYNQLAELDVSRNDQLIELSCGENQLTSLDLSANTRLEVLFCIGNSRLVEPGTPPSSLPGFDISKVIDMRGGTFMYGTVYYTADTISYDYDCGNGHKATFTMKNGAVPIDSIKFPDANFRAYVETLPGAEDGVFTQAELSEITKIDCNGDGKPDTEKIRDLTGIEHFTQLTTLYCGTNQLTSLDVSQNTQLKKLYCNSNQLTSLDVSWNTQLTTLYCQINQLTSLDMSQNTQLTSLYCYNNRLTSLDVSQNTQLKYLLCRSNQLTELDVSHIAQLIWLDCNQNKLTSLDVSRHTKLITLYCNNNQLTSLDVSRNTELTELDCSQNRLTELDVSQNIKLTELYCADNQLAGLDLTNNGQMNEDRTDLQNNVRSVPEGFPVSCLEGFFIGNAWDFKGGSLKNGTVHFNKGSEKITYTLRCRTTAPFIDTKFTLTKDPVSSIPVNRTLFPDDAFRSLIRSLPQGKDEVLTVEEIAQITNLNCSNLGIRDLRGVEQLIALESLDCSGNELVCADLSPLSRLEQFNAAGNCRRLEPGTLLSTLPGFKLGRAWDLTGGSLSEGQVDYDSTPGQITYTYYCGRGLTMTCTMTTEPVESRLISEASAVYSRPVYNQPANFEVILPPDAHYTAQLVWTDYDNVELQLGDSFTRFSSSYTATIRFTAEEGYRFASNVVASLNGREMRGDLCNAERTAFLSWYTNYAYPPIGELSASFPEPTPGSRAAQFPQLPEDAQYTAELTWIDRTDGTVLAPKAIFKSGHTYAAEVCFRPKDEYALAKLSSLLVGINSKHCFGDVGTPGVDYRAETNNTYTRIVSFVDPPTILPESITLDPQNGAEISIIHPNSNAAIYYRLDTEDLTPETGTLYTGPFAIREKTTVSAIAVVDGAVSAAAMKTYIPAGRTMSPSLHPEPGTYDGSVEVSLEPMSLTGGKEQQVLYYTTDGSAPTTASAVYTGPFTLRTQTEQISVTVKAMAVEPGMRPSPVTEGTYTLLKPSGAPEVTPGSMSFPNEVYPDPEGFWLRIKADNPAAKIYFTKTWFDADNPNPTLPDVTKDGPDRKEYEEPFDGMSTSYPMWINQNCIVRAVSYCNGSYSPVTTVRYTQMLKVSIPNGVAAGDVSIQANGVDYTGADMPLLLPEGTRITLDASAVTPAGYHFVGWDSAGHSEDIPYESKMDPQVSFQLFRKDRVYTPLFAPVIDRLYANFNPSPGAVYQSGFLATDCSEHFSAILSLGHGTGDSFRPLPNGTTVQGGVTYDARVSFTAVSHDAYLDEGGVTLTVNGQDYAAAKIVNDNYSASAKADLQVTIPDRTQDPHFPTGGNTFDVETLVTIVPPKRGVSLYYTTDGSVPTKNSTLYEGPFTLYAANQSGYTQYTVKVIAVEDGKEPSAIVEKDFFLKPGTLDNLELLLDSAIRELDTPDMATQYSDYSYELADIWGGKNYTVEKLRWYQDGALEYIFFSDTQTEEAFTANGGFQPGHTYTLKADICPKSGYALVKSGGQNVYGMVSGYGAQWEKENGRDVLTITYYPVTAEGDTDTDYLYPAGAQVTLNYDPGYDGNYEFDHWDWDWAKYDALMDKAQTHLANGATFTMPAEPVEIYAVLRLNADRFALIKSVDSSGVNLKISGRLKAGTILTAAGYDSDGRMTAVGMYTLKSGDVNGSDKQLTIPGSGFDQAAKVKVFQMNSDHTPAYGAITKP